uniref:mucosal pentraxin-like n=1 Tax=Euleptes europaea TaxID=460621 RepID=UPI00253FF044|nr:mucosal pentraxin-like [Euleptes europaea]
MHLLGKAFIFPEKGYDAYVTLNFTQVDPLHSFTLCLKSFTNLIQDYTLFSYSTQYHDRDISIYKTYMHGHPTFIVSIGGEKAHFRVPDSYLGWKSSCVTWSSETGALTLGMGGYVLARKVVLKGYSVGPNPRVTLGDVYWRTYWKSAFGGEIKDVYMWNDIIPMKDLKTTAWDFLSPSPIINWRNLTYEMYGNVTLI